jgi:DNA-binding NtrC family response regulator
MQQHGPQVYVVDDEKVIAETLAMILKRAGFAATAFENPRQALMAATSGESPDLLISDVVMPELSGIELAIEFRRRCPQCKVLLFSGQAATANLLESARNRGYDFEVLSKPVHPADLLARVGRELQPGEDLSVPAHSRSAPAVNC